MPAAPPSEFQQSFDEIISSDDSSQGKIRELMHLLRRVRRLKQKSSAEEDCPEPGDDDCRDLLSPCCDEPIRTVFGTLPVEAECSKCKERYSLRRLVAALSDA